MEYKDLSPDAQKIIDDVYQLDEWDQRGILAAMKFEKYVVRNLPFVSAALVGFSGLMLASPNDYGYMPAVILALAALVLSVRLVKGGPRMIFLAVGFVVRRLYWLRVRRQFKSQHGDYNEETDSPNPDERAQAMLARIFKASGYPQEVIRLVQSLVYEGMLTFQGPEHFKFENETDEEARIRYLAELNGARDAIDELTATIKNKINST